MKKCVSGKDTIGVPRGSPLVPCGGGGKRVGSSTLKAISELYSAIQI